VAVPRSPHPRKGFGPVDQLAERLRREVEQLRAERDEDVRAVAALRDALRTGGRGWGEADALIAHFADRIAALDDDETEES
jgi:hypothetical protein